MRLRAEYNEVIQFVGVRAIATPPDESAGNNTHPAPTNRHMAIELARVHRALQTLSAGNRTLLRALDERELLHDMCHVIVETGGYRMACVGYAEHDEQKSIHWMADVGIETDVLESLHVTWADTELGGSATAVAIRTGEPIVGRYLLTDPAYAGSAYDTVRETALQKGYAAVTALPLRMEGEVFGALTMGAVEPDAFKRGRSQTTQGAGG
jgi:GAF domain-containing protein